VNVVDSSGWLEYFAEGPNAKFFAPPLQASSDLLVPTLSLYEVFKRVFDLRGENAALVAVALMQQGGTVVDLTRSIAVAAARLSLELKLPMADSVMLATARQEDAVFWTQDADFQNVPGIKYIPKRPTTR
jgi:predicted nucleic acid-binding protein